MDELKSITPNSSVVKISACLDKIYKQIRESRDKKVAEHNIKEIEFLRTQCRTEPVQLSLISCQTFVRLVEDGVLEHAHVLAKFLSMFPNPNATLDNTVTEGLVSLLLLGLRKKVETLKPNEIYQCQLGLKTQQHPLITLLQHPGINLNNLSHKLAGICYHHDKQICDHSVEYLRPVFLYILCHPQTLPDAKSVWSILLALSRTHADAPKLMHEMLSWSKLTNAANCLFTSILLCEAIDQYLQQEPMLPNTAAHLIDLCIYQTLLVQHLVRFGIDPRPSLNTLLRVLKSTSTQSHNHYNVVLILCAEALHQLAPHYLPDLLRVISFIVLQESCGHQYILSMCLDAIIQWMSQTAFIPPDGLTLAHQLVQKILELQKGTPEACSTKDILSAQSESSSSRYFHPDIAIAFDIAKLVESFDASEFKDVFTFVDALNVRSNSAFCRRLNLFLRALFLSREPAADCWFKIYEVLLQIIKLDNGIAYDFLMTYIFKLAEETNPEIQIELLRGLPNFAVSKDNIPMILNTIRNLTAENPTFCMDLYLRLWRLEPRTYHFLIKLIALPHADSSSSDEQKRWEFEIAKTHTMREICEESPKEHGSDMVSHLSNTLNTCTDDDGDLATALALDAIVSLCESQTVNLTSVWRVLSSKFHNERRPRALKALYRYFAIVPLFQTPTKEFEMLVDEALAQLWLTVSRSDADAEVQHAALAALKNYDIGTLLTFRHIPPQFSQGVNGVREFIDASGRQVVDLQHDAVPGNCWVQLLQKIRPECGAAAADLIAHHIYVEIAALGRAIYCLPQHKPEPRNLGSLPQESPLRAIINYLVQQSHYPERVSEPHVVTNALRAISKKFSKPIPPLDWSFLHSFFHMSFEARKYAILIAKNQLLHSGTAQRILENFLVEFEPNCFEEDMLLLLSLLPEISNGVSLPIVKTFAEKVAIYCFKESQLSGFAEGCPFEKFLDSVKNVFTGKCEIPEVLDIFTLIVERYMDSMDLDSRLFERYTEVVAVLHPNAIDGLTTPANWWETPIGKLKKATIIRCYLVLYNNKLSNPLKWLAPIIEAFVTQRDEHVFLFRHLTATLYAFNSDEHTCNWIMELFLQIQTLLAESSNKEKLTKVLYLLDIFLLAVVVLSGCAVLLGNLDNVATQRNERFELFPESMQFLCDHVFWKEQEAKIYEFLYILYKNNAIPKSYATIFKNAIICSRNKPYFDNKSIWTKYVGLRRNAP